MIYQTDRKEYIFDEDIKLGGVEGLVISSSEKDRLRGTIHIVDFIEEIDFKAKWTADKTQEGYDIRREGRAHFTISRSFNELIEKYVIQSIADAQQVIK